jgi:antirestriction protein
LTVPSMVSNRTGEVPVLPCRPLPSRCFEGFGCRLHEYEDLANVVALANLIVERGEELASAVWDHAGGDESLARELIEDSYQGCFEDLETWAEGFLEDTGELDPVPEHLRPYLDVAAYARDMELSGTVFTIETTDGIYVFWNR